MNVKIRNKFIEIKYSVSYGLVIFITNYRWLQLNRSITAGQFFCSLVLMWVGNCKQSMGSQRNESFYD